MLDFYKRATFVLVLLTLISAIMAIVCIDHTYLKVNLLSDKNSSLAWWVDGAADQKDGGESSIKVNDTTFSLDFDIHIKKKISFPYANLSLVFGSEPESYALADLSRYQSLSFQAKCSPSNVLVLWLSNVDAKITKLDDTTTFRPSETYFSCDEEWREVLIDLSKLEIPAWWLEKYGAEISDQYYDLSQISRIGLGNTFQSPMDVESKIQVEQLVLHGREYRYLYILAGAMLLLWGGFVYWLFRAYSRALVEDLRSRLLQDRPLIAYQQLSIEPAHDRVRSALLRYLATEYANSELNLDTVVGTLGISRAKVNNILREECGYTFASYLNKLRLTEAVRLLTEAEGANVAEIAYSVGYNNVSYFNKRFKEEYGCTPKTFKSVSLDTITH